MSRKKPDAFTLFVPDEQEPEKDMPAKLEVVEYNPARRGKPAMGGGAYDPYERLPSRNDTARIRKPRVDLRRLSEWIKTTKKVEALRAAETPDGNTAVVKTVVAKALAAKSKTRKR